ncbi:MAG: chromate transporter [Oscillospiraceae bacterium]|nr:chromate transporter [Oscillospiraceae bacterium]
MLYFRLFSAFFQIGLFSFGGGYAAVPLIQRQIVENYHWMEMNQFADLITIAEMTPGPILINSATFVGQQLAGLPGALISTLGSIFPSFLIVLFLSFLYLKYRNLKTMQGILAGLRPAIVALIASAGLSLLTLALFDASPFQVQIENFHGIEAVIFVVSLFLLRRRKTGPIKIILGSGIVGTVAYLFLS